MPSQAEKGPARPTEWQPWPEQTRPHYIELFALQERTRGRLKLAQELAARNKYLKYGGNPRKTGPIKVSSKQDDCLKEYRDEQLPKVRDYLSRMQREIDEIKKAFESGRHPVWYKQTLEVERLTKRIWKKMNAIQINFMLTLENNDFSTRESNQSVIDETKLAIETAHIIRRELDYYRPERTALSLDEFGIFEIIVDASPKEPSTPAEKPYMDLSELWQQSRRSRG